MSEHSQQQLPQQSSLQPQQVTQQQQQGQGLQVSAQLQQQQQQHVVQPRVSSVVSMGTAQAQPTLAAATNALRCPTGQTAALPQLQVIGQPLHGQAYLPSFQGYAQPFILQNQNAIVAMNQMNQLNLAMQQQHAQQGRVAVSVNSDGTSSIITHGQPPQVAQMQLSNGATALITGNVQGMLTQASVNNSSNGAAAPTGGGANSAGTTGKTQQQQQLAAGTSNKTQVVPTGSLVGKAGGQQILAAAPQGNVPPGTQMVLGQIGVFSTQPSFMPQSSLASQQAGSIRLSAHPQHQQQQQAQQGQPGIPGAGSVTNVASASQGVPAVQGVQGLQGVQTVQSLLANQALMQAMANLQMQQQGLQLNQGHIISHTPTVFAGQNFVFRPAGSVQQQPITVTSLQGAFARPQQQLQPQQIVKTNASGKVMLPAVSRTPVTAKIQPNLSQHAVQPILGVATSTGQTASPKPTGKSRGKTAAATPTAPQQQLRVLAASSTITPTTTVISLSLSRLVSTPSGTVAMATASSSPATTMVVVPASATATVPSPLSVSTPSPMALGGQPAAAFPTPNQTPSVQQGVTSNVAISASPAPQMLTGSVAVSPHTTKVSVPQAPSMLASPAFSVPGAATPAVAKQPLVDVQVKKSEAVSVAPSSASVGVQPSPPCTPLAAPASTSKLHDGPLRTQIGDIVMVEQCRPSPSTTSTVSKPNSVFITSSSSATMTTTDSNINSSTPVDAAALEAAGLVTLVKEASCRVASVGTTKPMTVVGPSPQVQTSAPSTPITTAAPSLTTSTSSSISTSTTTTTSASQSSSATSPTTALVSTQPKPGSLPPPSALSSTPISSLGATEKRRAIVKPQPHIITHVIEGFVILEGPEPFPVQQSSLLQEFIPPKASAEVSKLSEEEDAASHDDEPPTLLSQRDAHLSSEPWSPAEKQTRKNSGTKDDKTSPATTKSNTKDEKTAKQPVAASPQKPAANMLKCELCQKVGPARTFCKSGRFCSTSCSGRHNVSHTRRVGLFKSKESARKRKIMGRKGLKTIKGRRMSSTKGDKSDEEEDEEEEEDEDDDEEGDDKEKEQDSGEKEMDQHEKSAAAGEEAVASAQATSSPGVSSGAPTALDFDSAEADGNIPNSDPGKWSVLEVYQFIFHLPGCREYASDFRSQEIDGQALLLLKEDHLMTAMNIKLGPALKICSKINALRAEHAGI